jgi:hypothetical protein
MLDDPTNATFAAGPKRAGQDGRPDPNGRVCRGSSATTQSDLGELLDGHVHPAVAHRVNAAFREYGFVDVATLGWLSRRLPASPAALVPTEIGVPTRMLKTSTLARCRKASAR